MSYEWDFDTVFRQFDMLLYGMWGTIKLTAIALVLGLIIGLVAALMRLSKKRYLNAPAGVYIEIFRSTPPLVQLFWTFYALPIILGIELGPFQAAIITFSFQSGAFFAEHYRAGIISIDKDQWEGGRALGMDYKTLMRRIILPQAIKRMIPGLTNRSIELMKTTTLVATIGFTDLLYQALLMSQRSYRPLEVFTIAAAIYFVVLFICSMGSRLLERKLKVV